MVFQKVEHNCCSPHGLAGEAENKKLSGSLRPQLFALGKSSGTPDIRPKPVHLAGSIIPGSDAISLYPGKTDSQILFML